MGREAIMPRRDAAEAITLLGAAIRAVRVEKGWTQEDLAAAIATTRRTVSNIEKGHPATSIGHVFSAASVLGLPLFDTDSAGLTQQRKTLAHVNALLPARVVNPPRKVPTERDF